MEFGGSPPSTSLTEDKFDLIAAESMFGQHLELQHLSEGDSDASDDNTTVTQKGTSRDPLWISVGLGGGRWDTWVGHLGGTLGLGLCMTNLTASLSANALGALEGSDDAPHITGQYTGLL